MSQGDKQKLNVRGFNLAYLRRGKGEPLLLIHGITTYSFIWQDVIPHLQGSFDVIAIDLLGCGDSDKPTNTDYSLKAQAELIKDFLEALGLDRVHLVCHDIGGGIGQVLSVKYPERLKTLTLINTVGYDYWPVQPIKSLRIPFFRQMAMAVMDLGLFRAVIKRAIYHKERLTDELMEQFLRPLRTKEGRQGFLHLAKCLNNRDLLEIEEKLKDLEIPVLIIRGDRDVYLSPRISERLKEDIKGSVFRLFKHAGHFVQIDEPLELASTIKDFILKKSNE